MNLTAPSELGLLSSAGAELTIAKDVIHATAEDNPALTQAERETLGGMAVFLELILVEIASRIVPLSLRLADLEAASDAQQP